MHNRLKHKINKKTHHYHFLPYSLSITFNLLVLRDNLNPATQLNKENLNKKSNYWTLK